MKKIEIEIPDGKRAEWLNGVLTLVDDTPKDVTERIKTFMDACAELGNEHPFVKSYEKYVNTASQEDADVIAYLKLRIITAALNEGWEPQFVEGERRWYAWYDFITEEDYNDMTDEEKCRVVARGSYGSSAGGGLSCASASFVSSYSSAYYGSRLALKSKELAEYAAKQFIDIYADYCFKK
jgi:hypothetical protein